MSDILEKIRENAQERVRDVALIRREQGSEADRFLWWESATILWTGLVSQRRSKTGRGERGVRRYERTREGYYDCLAHAREVS